MYSYSGLKDTSFHTLSVMDIQLIGHSNRGPLPAARRLPLPQFDSVLIFRVTQTTDLAIFRNTLEIHRYNQNTRYTNTSIK